MTQVIHPSTEACSAMLRSAPAITAFRRSLYRVAPAESRGWLGTLAVVARHDGMRPTQVADMLHLDLSVVSRTLAQLVDLGYVSRDRDPDDRRAFVARVTPDGSAWLEDITARFAERLSSDLPGWSDEELVTLAESLHRFGATLEAAQAEGSDTP